MEKEKYSKEKIKEMTKNLIIPMNEVHRVSEAFGSIYLRNAVSIYNIVFTLTYFGFNLIINVMPEDKRIIIISRCGEINMWHLGDYIIEIMDVHGNWKMI